MKTTKDLTPLFGTVVVILTWKYKDEQEVRKKVFLHPEDYQLLRILLAGQTGPKADNLFAAAEDLRQTYATGDTLSTTLTTISDISRLMLVQKVGQMTGPK